MGNIASESLQIFYMIVLRAEIFTILTQNLRFFRLEVDDFFSIIPVWNKRLKLRNASVQQ